MAESIVLDPGGIATDRTPLDITSWVSVDGVDWGDAAIEAYMAAGSGYSGSVPVDFRVPNRTITIPLRLRAVGATTFDTIRSKIQAKVALFQRERGWVGRNVKGVQLYADVVNASLHLGGSWFQAYKDFDIDATLTLECVPDFYGEEVDVGSHTETVLPSLVFIAGTAVAGNHPGRTRIVVTNNAAGDWHSLLWGVRSRHYDSAPTAALRYEAEAFTPLTGTAVADALASGGTAVLSGTLVPNTWVPVLQTNMLVGGSALTHQGVYRVWARARGPAADVVGLRLAWGAGALALPKNNDGVSMFAGTYGMSDLGPVVLTPPPVGPARWTGVFQAYCAGTTTTVSIDEVLFQPLDEYAGKLTYISIPPASSSAAGPMFAGSAANDSATGTIDWSTPGNATAEDGSTAGMSNLTGSSTLTTHYLKTGAHGFAIPTSATVNGIRVEIKRSAVVPAFTTAFDHAVRLVLAGTVQADDRSAGGWLTPLQWIAYGGPTDLWGRAWTASEVNASGFGAAFSVSLRNVTSAPPGGVSGSVDAIRITVYYTLASGFTLSQDAVAYASQAVELRSEGIFRQDTSGVAYGPPGAVYGDLPRIPPSGLENRQVEFFLRPSRGDLAAEADTAIDDLAAHVYYRPSYLTTS